MDPLADLTSHRIEGIAVMGNTPFSVPLISHVGLFNMGQLSQGGCKDGLTVDFDVIISLYPWERYDFNGHTRIEVQMFDSLGQIPEVWLDNLADQIDFHLKGGERVLVHCQAGLNRSSLLIAHYLMRHQGLKAEEAINLVRGRRSPACLCNPDFEAWLRR